MSFLKIICPRPGYRRAGIALAAVTIRPADAFTGEQIDALRADPQLTVADLTAEEAEAELRASAAAVVTSAPDASAPRKIVTDVLHLLMPEASEPLLVQTSTAVLDALANGTSPSAFRAIAEGIFAAHARAVAAERTNTEGAPPADADAPSSTATTTIEGAAETEAAGAVSASAPAEDGEGGQGAQTDAAEDAAPAPSEGAKGRRKAR